MPKEVLKASGHVDNFTDPMTKCEECGEVFRADHIIEEVIGEDVESLENEELDKIVIDNNIKCPDAEREFNDKVAEIQTRYGDKDLEEAERLRAKELKSLKMEIVRKPVRKILGETGKLEQMYRSRKSGAANNAKDWLRGWVGLDDEGEMYKEIRKYEQQRRKKAEELAQKRKDGEPELEDSGAGRIYTDADRDAYQAEMSEILNEHRNDELEDFFDATKAKLEEWFPGDYFVEAYKQYYEDNEEFLSNSDLYGWIQDMLADLDEYPGNRDRK